MKLFKLLPSTLLYFAEGDPGGGGDVQTDTSPSVEPSGDAASSAVTESSDDQQIDAGTVQASEQESAEDDPLKDVPTVEELNQLAEQKVPHAQALARLRTAYEASKEQLKPFEAWKPVIESIPDPATVQSNHELLSLLYSPSQSGDPNDYSTAPFLERLEQDSPGSIDKMYRDLTGMAVEINGQRDTLTRHMVRSWGLNPDNLEKYRQLENGTLPVASGIVNSEDLAKIPQAYQEGFKSLPAQAQKDILALTQSENESERLMAQTYLQNAQQAREAQTFREQVEQQRQAEQRRLEVETAQKIETESQQAIDQLTSEVYDSIRQSLAQVKVSSNELENELHVGSQMALLYTAIDPAGRKMILDPLLSKLGISLDSAVGGVQVRFDDVVNTIAQKTAEAVKWTHLRDTRQANLAKAAATQARQILTAKLNQVASKLASPARSNGNGNGATARQLPSGNGLQQQSNSNPYELPEGIEPFTAEARAYRASVDRQMAR